MIFSLDTLIIAVDFDGTIVEDAYPKIGKPQIFAFETLKSYKMRGIVLFYGLTEVVKN
jgi:hypothetical protein